MKKGNETSLMIGAVGLGAYLLFKSMGNVPNGEGLPSGSVGGTDDLMGHQGFDIDPNQITDTGGSTRTISYEPQEPEVLDYKPKSDPIAQAAFMPVEIDLSGTGYMNPYAEQTQPLPKGFKIFVSPIDNTIIGYKDPIKQQSILGDPFENPFSSINVKGTFFEAVGEAEKKVMADKALSGTGKTIMYGDDGSIIGYNDAVAQQSVLKSEAKTEDVSSGLLGSGISTNQFALGSSGFMGSYFTSAGESLIKNTPDGISISKGIYQGGIESIPFMGQKAVKLVAEETGESLLKKGVKTSVSLVPFIGTVGGAEFDVAFSGKSRPSAYTANAVGDVAGGLLATAALPLGGVASPAMAVAGQIGGEQITYSIWDFLFPSSKPKSESGSSKPILESNADSGLKNLNMLDEISSSANSDIPSASNQRIIEATNTPYDRYRQIATAPKVKAGEQSVDKLVNNDYFPSYDGKKGNEIMKNLQDNLDVGGGMVGSTMGAVPFRLLPPNSEGGAVRDLHAINKVEFGGAMADSLRPEAAAIIGQQNLYKKSAVKSATKGIAGMAAPSQVTSGVQAGSVNAFILNSTKNSSSGKKTTKKKIVSKAKAAVNKRRAAAKAGKR